LIFVNSSQPLNAQFAIANFIRVFFIAVAPYTRKIVFFI